MIFWIRLKNFPDNEKRYIRIEEKWQNYFYVASDNISKLEQLVQNDNILSSISSYEFVKRYETIMDTKKSIVLKLSMYGKNLKFANTIEKMNGYQNCRLYNVDLIPEQKYFFDHDIFPLGLFEVTDDNSVLHWEAKNDGIWSTDYHIPYFKKIHIKLNFPKGKIIKLEDELNSISIVQYNDTNSIDNKNKIDIVDLSDKSEKKLLKELLRIVQDIDPDFIFTEDGDSFTFPYLTHRAEINKIDLCLGRDNNMYLTKPERKGNSFFSYGRTYFRPSTIKLFGRIHIDKSNTFTIRTGSDLEGLFEISRLCRIPLHEASRASIGRCLTSLHLYNATKKGLLIPWKPILFEHPKNMLELFLADRGGLILEPEMGLHEKIAEFDFVSLYPSIMLKRNVSAETILCDCCFDNPKFRVPELNYHICNKKGLIPLSLEIVLDKRLRYKNLKNKTSDPILKDIYDKRQSALKWILVTSFGYLGFSNAKFGRIDAHIAVCAFARNILSQTMHIAEDMNFDVLHGIVDSIWVKKRDDAANNDYTNLKETIKKETGFDVSFEGVYKWIAFLSSEINSHIPVLNRYFGVFEDGTIKTRGIEGRRHDTPDFLVQCQNEILEILAQGNSIQDIKQNKLSLIIKKIKDNLSLLKYRKVEPESLVFTKLLSKDYNQYHNRNTLENSAIKQLELNGEYLKAGQILQYVIMENSGPILKRVLPIQLLNNKNYYYDIKRYSELLINTCNNIIKPFGIIFDQNQSVCRLDNYH
ncbi:MAG TPA: DNA polymerase domain-containing protein [Nitrososphaeraceae archaeon]|nr:DNA polymerase domain-containing protein [Nitrososphaeraceae archaeon]